MTIMWVGVFTLKSDDVFIYYTLMMSFFVTWILFKCMVASCVPLLPLYAFLNQKIWKSGIIFKGFPQQKF